MILSVRKSFYIHFIHAIMSGCDWTLNVVGKKLNCACMPVDQLRNQWHFLVVCIAGREGGKRTYKVMLTILCDKCGFTYLNV